MLYMLKGMSLDEVVVTEAVPFFAQDSEAIAMKLIAGADHLKSKMKKAVKDFDDAMKLFGKLYHKDGVIGYKSKSEKMAVKMAFSAFYPLTPLYTGFLRTRVSRELGRCIGLKRNGRSSSRSTRFASSSPSYFTYH